MIPVSGFPFVLVTVAVAFLIRAAMRGRDNGGVGHVTDSVTAHILLAASYLAVGDVGYATGWSILAAATITWHVVNPTVTGHTTRTGGNVTHPRDPH